MPDCTLCPSSLSILDHRHTTAWGTRPQSVWQQPRNGLEGQGFLPTKSESTLSTRSPGESRPRRLWETPPRTLKEANFFLKSASKCLNSVVIFFQNTNECIIYFNFPCNGKESVNDRMKHRNQNCVCYFTLCRYSMQIHITRTQNRMFKIFQKYKTWFLKQKCV